MYDSALTDVTAEQFEAIWNGAASVAEVVDRVTALTGKGVPRWAVMARAAAIRKAGILLKPM